MTKTKKTEKTEKTRAGRSCSARRTSSMAGATRCTPASPTRASVCSRPSPTSTRSRPTRAPVRVGPRRREVVGARMTATPKARALTVRDKAILHEVEMAMTQWDGFHPCGGPGSRVDPRLSTLRRLERLGLVERASAGDAICETCGNERATTWRLIAATTDMVEP